MHIIMEFLSGAVLNCEITQYRLHSIPSSTQYRLHSIPSQLNAVFTQYGVHSISSTQYHLHSITSPLNIVFTQYHLNSIPSQLNTVLTQYPLHSMPPQPNTVSRQYRLYSISSQVRSFWNCGEAMNVFVCHCLLSLVELAVAFQLRYWILHRMPTIFLLIVFFLNTKYV